VLSSTNPNRCRTGPTRRVRLARPLQGRPSFVEPETPRGAALRATPYYPRARARTTLRRKVFDALIEPLVPLPLWRNVPTNPELSLYAEVVFDAVRLVRGESVVMSNRVDVRAARHWIEAGDIGVVTFDACCAWLGWDAGHTREAIFSFVRAA